MDALPMGGCVAVVAKGPVQYRLRQNVFPPNDWPVVIAFPHFDDEASTRNAKFRQRFVAKYKITVCAAFSSNPSGRSSGLR